MTPADLAEEDHRHRRARHRHPRDRPRPTRTPRGPADRPGDRRRAHRVRQRARDAPGQDRTPPSRPPSSTRRTCRPSPVSPQPVRNLGLAVVLGLLLGVGLAVVRELLDTSVKGPDDIAQITDTPVLGGILFDPQRTQAAADLADLLPALAARRGLPDPADQPAVRRRRPDQEGLRRHQLGAGRGQDQHGQQHRAGSADRRAADAAHRRRPAPAAARRAFDLEGSVGLTSILLGRIDLDEAVQEHRRVRPVRAHQRLAAAQPGRAAPVPGDAAAARPGPDSTST